MTLNKTILFITSTRADFGKIKCLMHAVDKHNSFELRLFVTGMHTLKRYGLTENEVKKEGFKYIYTYINQIEGEPMDLVLANTIVGFSKYISEYPPDLIVTHGDRIEALACAIVGSIKNILTVHIEGGEKSGTIDGLIRHAITKLAHVHLVANNDSRDRILQMGEQSSSVFLIGSPEVDLILLNNFPNIEEVKKRYEITFKNYVVCIFHPNTLELSTIHSQVKELIKALKKSGLNYVIIYPNNDEGCQFIFKVYNEEIHNPRFRFLPSMRFEYFQTVLKNSMFIIGNSSTGIREAPLYAKYAINIGTRQKGRKAGNNVINCDPIFSEILSCIKSIGTLPPMQKKNIYGDGNSAKLFIELLESSSLWEINTQKEFVDMTNSGEMQ